MKLEAFGQQRHDQVLGQQADDTKNGDEPGIRHSYRSGNVGGICTEFAMSGEFLNFDGPVRSKWPPHGEASFSFYNSCGW